MEVYETDLGHISLTGFLASFVRHRLLIFSISMPRNCDNTFWVERVWILLTVYVFREWALTCLNWRLGELMQYMKQAMGVFVCGEYFSLYIYCADQWLTIMKKVLCLWVKQMAEAINLVEFSCDGRLCISYSDLDVNVDAKHCQWDNVLKLVTEAHRSRAFLASPLRNLTTKLLWKWIHHESDVLGNYSLHLSLNLRTTNLTESGRIK